MPLFQPGRPYVPWRWRLKVYPRPGAEDLHLNLGGGVYRNSETLTDPNEKLLGSRIFVVASAVVADSPPRLAISLQGNTNEGGVVRAVVSDLPEIGPPQIWEATAGPGPRLNPAVQGQTNQQASREFRNEIRTITISDTAGAPVNSGNFTITFRGQTTAGIDCTAQNETTTRLALEALSNVEPGDFIVTNLPLSGAEQTKQTIEFTGQYAREDIATSDFQVNPGTMDDPTITVGNTQQGFNLAVASPHAPAEPDLPQVDSPRLIFDLPAFVEPPVAPTVLSPIVQGQTNQGGHAQAAPEPLEALREQVSKLYGALAIGPLPPIVPLPIALQGFSNSGPMVSKQVPLVPQWEPRDPIPQVFVYVNAAPPIFNVITPGTTNQGYKFKGTVEPHSPDQRLLGTRFFKITIPQGTTFQQSIQASLSLTPAVSVLVRKNIVGDLVLTGAVSKLVRKTVAGDLVLTGAVTTVFTAVRTITGSLTLTGAIGTILNPTAGIRKARDWFFRIHS